MIYSSFYWIVVPSRFRLRQASHTFDFVFSPTDARPSGLTCARSSGLRGARLSNPTDARPSGLTGARSSSLKGAWPSGLTSARSSSLKDARPSGHTGAHSLRPHKYSTNWPYGAIHKTQGTFKTERQRQSPMYYKSKTDPHGL
ncbi:hypothetical protein LR48_Vigan477s001100 [Vigna angularis]|uniref:Uncharacterized protein n=1 Tax=Phaseolus angularis TaxID=3914 RepID=A0A0L9TCW3_PHAAN|nr:hypothetical protein LR48_Vigan477s001100 [Vigna angularis]